MVVSRNGQESQSSKKPTTDYYVRGDMLSNLQRGFSLNQNTSFLFLSVEYHFAAQNRIFYYCFQLTWRASRRFWRLDLFVYIIRNEPLEG